MEKTGKGQENLTGWQGHIQKGVDARDRVEYCWTCQSGGLEKSEVSGLFEAKGSLRQVEQRESMGNLARQSSRVLMYRAAVHSLVGGSEKYKRENFQPSPPSPSAKSCW